MFFPLPSSIFHHPSSIFHHPSDIRQAYEYKLFIRFPFICAKPSFHIFHYNVSISFSVKPVRSAIVATSKPRAFILRAMSRLCSARPSARFVNHQALLPCLFRPIGKSGTKQSGAHYQIIVFLHFTVIEF